MFCTTIIPTIGRETLSRAVQSVLDQDFSASPTEIIVVNDSGHVLPYFSWQESPIVRIIDTNRRERSVARNSGAAMAQGEFLHFLDDDDWLLPGAFTHFWSLAQQAADAAWLYGDTQLVDRNDNPTIMLRPSLNGNCFIQVIAGEWIPLQSSLIRTDVFFTVGGFEPLISGSEDIDLSRRVALHGDFAKTANLVACIRVGLGGDSTMATRRTREGSQWGREKILSEPGAFPRMQASAKSSYYHGRIVRAYFTSAVWNIRKRSGFTAISRLLTGVFGFILAIRFSLSPSFWQAIIREYSNPTFRAGFSERIRAEGNSS